MLYQPFLTNKITHLIEHNVVGMNHPILFQGHWFNFNSYVCLECFFLSFVIECYSISLILNEYDQEIPQSQTADNPWHRSTITRHQEDKLSKAISSLFPIKMIAILEWT